MDIDLSEFLLSYAPLVIALPILLGFSAFFSASEVAFFSLKNTIINERAPSDAVFAKIQSLLATPKRLLATMLIGNTLANAALVITAVSFTERWIEEKALHLEGSALPFALVVSAMAFIILIFGEIAPKTFAAKHSESVAVRAVRVVNFFQILFLSLHRSGDSRLEVFGVAGH